jgi:hypothetical protein
MTPPFPYVTRELVEIEIDSPDPSHMQRDLALRGMVFCLLLLAACGGDDSNSCPDVAPCGGNVVGTWRVDAACLEGLGTAAANAGGLNSFCSEASVSTSGLSMTGSTITYNADGTYSQTSKISGTFTINLPVACLTQRGVTVTCDQLNQSIAQSNQSSSASAGFTGLHCNGGFGGGCACNARIEQNDTSSGRYTIQGSQLTDADGPTDFCVQGDTLYEQSTAQTTMSMGMMGQMQLSARAVLSRQK